MGKGNELENAARMMFSSYLLFDIFVNLKVPAGHALSAPLLVIPASSLLELSQGSGGMDDEFCEYEC